MTFSYLYYIVNFVCRSLDNNVKAAVVRARVGQSDGRGRGGKGGKGGRDGSAAGGAAPGVEEVKEHTPGDNLSFILESTLISDVISLVQVPIAQQPWPSPPPQLLYKSRLPKI